MMELLLNAIWLVLTLTALGCCLARFHKSRQNRYRRILVLGCIAALLFPVVSITDDLVAQPLVAEDASTPSKHLQKHADRADVPITQHAILVNLSATSTPVWKVLDRLTVETPVALPWHAGSDQSQRAPPCA